MKADWTINSHYITHTFVLQWLGEFVLWAWEWKANNPNLKKLTYQQTWAQHSLHSGIAPVLFWEYWLSGLLRDTIEDHPHATPPPSQTPSWTNANKIVKGQSTIGIAGITNFTWSSQFWKLRVIIVSTKCLRNKCLLIFFLQTVGQVLKKCSTVSRKPISLRLADTARNNMEWWVFTNSSSSHFLFPPKLHKSLPVYSLKYQSQRMNKT